MIQTLRLSRTSKEQLKRRNKRRGSKDIDLKVKKDKEGGDRESAR